MNSFITKSGTTIFVPIRCIFEMERDLDARKEDLAHLGLSELCCCRSVSSQSNFIVVIFDEDIVREASVSKSSRFLHLNLFTIFCYST